jgi:hypothetical protein
LNPTENARPFWHDDLPRGWFEAKRFQQVYDRMRSWGLASGEADHARLVASL